MIKDYKAPWTETVTDYCLNFYSHSDGGYGFPCDEHGNVKKDDMQEIAVRNYEYCMANPDKFPYAWNEIEKRTRSYRNPASGTCHCGERINLYNDYMGACECPNCGQWYNLFGEELLPPKMWEENIDEEDY